MKKYRSKDIIVKTSADIFIPFALIFGFYIILHGNLSPGGGFQGGVLVASAVVMLYLGYGFKKASTAIRPEVLHKNEAVAAVCYVLLALLGLFMGLALCDNIFSDMGAIGDLFSAGTISLMNYAVGYKVLTGVGFLLLLMLGLLADNEEEDSHE